MGAFDVDDGRRLKVWERLDEDAKKVGKGLHFTRAIRFGHDASASEIEIARIDNGDLWLNKSHCALSKDEAIKLAKWILKLYSDERGTTTR